MKMEQSVPKRRHIKFRRRGITEKKAYNKLHFDLLSELKADSKYFCYYLVLLLNLLAFCYKNIILWATKC